MAAQPAAQRKAAKQAKILQSLRNIQTEQTLRLQQMYQFEQDLLEDIRAYAKQRSTIEKEYAQALLKLDTQFIQKRDFAADDIAGTDRHRTPLGVWKMVLDESENISKQRMEISDGLQVQIADNIKTVKAHKTQVYKKCQELLQNMQEDVFTTVREMSKAKKGYMEFEKLAQVAKEQAAEAEDKYKKKNVKFFQSKSTLEKNVSKSSSRKEMSEKRATMARNEYLLCLAASNAHMMRYYCNDLQEIMTNVYGDFYEKMREYFSSISKMEVDASSGEQRGFDTVGTEAAMISRDYCVECFLAKNKVFTEVLRYEFDPWKGDKINTLLTTKTAGLSLNKEARKLAMRLAREQRNIKEKQKILNALQSSNADEASVTTEGSQQENEQNPETLKGEIRHSEIIKLKSEACLDLLREAGVNVEEWMKSANSLTPAEAESDKGFGGSSNSLNSNTAEEPSGWDDEWDVDDTFNGDYSDEEEDATSVTSTGSLPAPAVVLYNFEASTEEELSITEHEELELLERDGEGWCKGRNKSGKVGFFPETYVEVRSKERASSASTHSSGHSGSFTSSLGSSPVATAKAVLPQETQYLCLVKALYDYESMSDEEISFQEGDIIHVTKKDDNGVDDGFWEGYINGQHGVFPSLVVEEIEGSAPPAATTPNGPGGSAPPATIANDPVGTGALQNSVPVPAYNSQRRPDDYIELPDDYSTIGCAPPLIQPARRAPAPPKDSPRAGRRRGSDGSRNMDPRASQGNNNMDPIDRSRAKTENVTSLRKPDTSASYGRSVSHDSKRDYENVDAYASVMATQSGDYVNSRDLPQAGPDNGPSWNTKAKGAKPSLPPPPTAASRRSYQSQSNV